MILRPEAGLKHRLPRGGDHCDFCGFPEVSRLLGCRNFEWDGHAVFRSTMGRWAACDLCGHMVQGGRWGALATRVMHEVGKRSGLTPDDVRYLKADLRRLYSTLKVHLVDGEVLQVHFPAFRIIDIRE